MMQSTHMHMFSATRFAAQMHDSLQGLVQSATHPNPTRQIADENYVAASWSLGTYFSICKNMRLNSQDADADEGSCSNET